MWRTGAASPEAKLQAHGRAYSPEIHTIRQGQCKEGGEELTQLCFEKRINFSSPK